MASWVAANVARLFGKNISDLALVRGVNLPMRASRNCSRRMDLVTIFNSRENVPGSKCSVWSDLKMGPEQLVRSQPRHK